MSISPTRQDTDRRAGRVRKTLKVQLACALINAGNRLLDSRWEVYHVGERTLADQAGHLTNMMARQTELYNLNGMPNIDFNRTLGLEARRRITEGIGVFVKSMIHEAVELENWTQWKPWSRRLGNKSDIEQWSEEHIREMRMEVIDLQAFVFNLCILLGMTPAILHEMYCEKADINVYDRHESGTY